MNTQSDKDIEKSLRHIWHDGDGIPMDVVGQDRLDELKGDIDCAIAGYERRGRRTLRLWRVWGRVAAVLVIALGAGLVWMARQHLTVDAGPMATVVTDAGERATVILPDGSRVTLNQCSSLSYPVSIATDSVRRIIFEGEAYFNIAYAAGQPLDVETTDVAVRVTGTEFNVNAYDCMASVTVALDKGAVSLVPLHRRDVEPVPLKPGQIAEYDRATGHVDIHEAHTQASSSWLRHQISYYDISPDSLIVSIESQYNITLSADTRGRITERFTGSLPDDNLPETLTILSKLYGFNPSAAIVIEEER